MKTEAEIEKILTRPLDAEAIKPPNSKGLSSIKGIYITERLNEAYGRGQWSLKATDMGAEMWMQKVAERENGVQKKDSQGNLIFKEKEMYTAKMHVCITLPNGTSLDCVATSENDDEGDASKGAISDCISKIGSWLGIGAHIWKGQTLEKAWQEWNNKYNRAPTYEEELAKHGKHSTVVIIYANALGIEVPKMESAEHAEKIGRELHAKYYGK